MEEIKRKLSELRDEEYGDFMSSLLPGIPRETILGVRIPELRKLARSLKKETCSDLFLRELPHTYYDENNLHAFLIEEKAESFEQAVELTEEFLPYLDNWQTCDSFHPKIFGTDPERLYEKTEEWMKSRHAYTVRYGIVMQIRYFLDDRFLPEMPEQMAGIQSDDYYVRMALSWYFSVALVKQYEQTIPLFKEKRLDRWIHNKALQKAVESHRITEEIKAYLRTMKR